MRTLHIFINKLSKVKIVDSTYKMEIVWSNVILYSVFHIVAFVVSTIAITKNTKLSGSVSVTNVFNKIRTLFKIKNKLFLNLKFIIKLHVFKIQQEFKCVLILFCV